MLKDVCDDGFYDEKTKTRLRCKIKGTLAENWAGSYQERVKTTGHARLN